MPELKKLLKELEELKKTINSLTTKTELLETKLDLLDLKLQKINRHIFLGFQQILRQPVEEEFFWGYNTPSPEGINTKKEILDMSSF